MSDVPQVESAEPHTLDTFMHNGTGQAKELDVSEAIRQLDRAESIKTDAERIFRAGGALDYMCLSCARLHADDRNIIRTLFLSYASVFVKNCHGVNVEITGSAGSGKTHIIKTVLIHTPKDSRLKAKLSDKALYYHELGEGTILAYDDQDLSEDMQSTVKNLSWDEPTALLTVKQQSKLTLTIPARCPYWNTKVEGSGDEQIQDRVIKFWADESEEHKKRRDEMENEYLENPALLEESNYSAEVCQRIWQNIRGDDKKVVNKYTVVVPFASRIKGGDGDARTRNLFIALIQASCILHMPKREQDHHGFYVATEEDFWEAEKIVNPLMRNEGGSQGKKINRSAMKVLDVLKEKPSETYAFEFLMKWCSLSKSQLTHAIEGRRIDGMDGLISKCPAISTTTLTTSKQTPILCGEDEASNKESWTRLTSSRKGIIWNRELFEKWMYCSTYFYLDEGENQEPQPCTPEEEQYLYTGFAGTAN